MKLIFHGAAKEVGRSGLTIKGRQTQILIDYGVMIDRQPGFPMHVSPKEIDAIVLTHAHLDHSGAIPFFHTTTPIPVYSTPPTFDLTKL